jgi:Holliday junction resolvase RusA-like endonuclease
MKQKKKVEFTLPFPPTINDYYGNRKGGGRYLNPKAKNYLEKMPMVIKSLTKRVKLKGKIKIDYLFACPDNRKHDIGNLYKGLDDAIEKSGLIENDNDIYRGKTEKVYPDTVRLIVEEI